MSNNSELEKLRTALIDPKQPIAKRTHAAFILRTMGTEAAADVLMEDIIGQLRMPKYIKQLSTILECETEDTLVRHESAEALGAIGDPSALSTLERFVNHPLSEISETCQIAVDLIKYEVELKNRNITTQESKVYASVDPAPPFEISSKDPVELAKKIKEYEEMLIDTKTSLFLRYRAMFSLRDINNDASAVALAHGFKDTSSALFRHELAYVLGQMQRKVTIPHLAEVLRDEKEHKMVRHEAAEALGAVGGEIVEKILDAYKLDNEDVVRESALVALDTMDYWSNFNATTEVIDNGGTNA